MYIEDNLQRYVDTSVERGMLISCMTNLQALKVEVVQLGALGVART